MGDQVLLIKEGDYVEMLGEYTSDSNVTTETPGEGGSDTGGTTPNGVYAFMWVYISPAIFVVGLCGNILIMAVMTRPKLRGSSATVYLPLIALFDVLVLITGNIQ